MSTDAPMDETHFMDRFDSQDQLCHVEARDIFTKGVVLDEHGHEITSREKLH